MVSEDERMNEILHRLAPSWEKDLTADVVARCFVEIMKTSGNSSILSYQQQNAELRHHLGAYV